MKYLLLLIVLMISFGAYNIKNTKTVGYIAIKKSNNCVFSERAWEMQCRVLLENGVLVTIKRLVSSGDRVEIRCTNTIFIKNKCHYK